MHRQLEAYYRGMQKPSTNSVIFKPTFLCIDNFKITHSINEEMGTVLTNKNHYKMLSSLTFQASLSHYGDISN